MVWLRLLIVFLFVLLAALIGLGAWDHAHRGYPNTVYYYHQVLVGTPRYPGDAVDVWIDPRRHWERVLIDYGHGTDTLLLLDGLRYDLSDASAMPIVERESTFNLRSDAALLSGGSSGLAAYWATASRGQIAHTFFYGRAAIRFAMAGDTQLSGDILWLDARTHELIGRQYTDQLGNRYVQRYSRWGHYAPNTLPAGFFDPPTSQKNI